MTSNTADFETKGAQHFTAVLSAAELDRVEALFGNVAVVGLRLSATDLQPIADLFGPNGAVGRIASHLIGDLARPVRALLLDKSPEANWRLGWHQDRVIAVRERVEGKGFGAWSVKSGQLHVQPPIEILARMTTLRVHVDPVDHGNAPLRVLPGSHVLGRLTEEDIETLAAKADAITCVAQAGDVWACSTPIVHASSEQRRPGRRRVLQLDYSADDLPGELEWQLLI